MLVRESKPTYVIFDRCVAAIWSFFMLGGLIRAWWLPSGGHTHRQTDTAGVALSMAQVWLEQGVWKWVETLFYPVILQRAGGNGLNPMEFPLLCFGASPFFLMGPRIGTACTVTILLFFHTWVAWHWIPRLFSPMVIRPWVGVALLFSQYSVLFSASVFMPESLAFPLALIGIVWIKEGKRGLLGAVTLGIASSIKPPVIVGSLILFGFHAIGQSRDWSQIRKRILLVACTACFPMYWFLIHCPKITAATTSPIVFATLALDPLGRLQSAGVAGALDLLFRQINGFHFPFGVGPLLVLGALFFYPWMVALFSLAFLGGLSLIGPWAAQHAYYFFGSSIVSTGVLVSLMHGKGKFKSTLGTLTQWSLLIGMAYCAREPWWVLSRTPNDWKMGSRAKEYVDGIRKTSTNLQVFTDDQTCPSKLLLSHSPGWMLGTNLKQFELHCSTRGPDALFIVDATTWKSETIENYLCLKRLNSIEISDPKQNLQWLLLRQPH